MTRTLPVYLYDLEMNFIRKFETTQECAEYFGKERLYINHSLKYRAKIRKDGKWYIIRRNRTIREIIGDKE